MAYRDKRKSKSRSITHDQIEDELYKMDVVYEPSPEPSFKGENVVSFDVKSIADLLDKMDIADQSSPEIVLTPSTSNKYRVHKWKLDMDMVRKWKPLDDDFQCPMKTDCVINALTVLGAIKGRGYAETLARIRNMEQTGVENNLILDMVYYYQLADSVRANKQSYTHKVSLYNPHYDEHAFDWLKQELDNGEAVFTIVFSKTFAHAIVLYKYNDIIHLFDPQMNILLDEKNLQSYIEMHGVYEYQVMMEYTKPIRKRHETLLKIRKSPRLSPEAKRTRKNSPVHSPHVWATKPKRTKKTTLRKYTARRYAKR